VTLTLRDYQGREGALGAVEKALAAGCRRQLVSLPTGTGKTCVFSNLPSIGLRRLLVVAHREELLDQAADKLRHWNPGLTVQVDQADRWADVGTLSAFDGALFAGTGYAVCASVATIGRAGSRRLTRYPSGLFDAVVIDEAHHSSAQSYQSVIEHFGAGKLGGPLLLGVTATPFRADGADLSKVYEKVVYSLELPDAINRGYLVDIRALAVATGVNLDGVTATREDFRVGELAEAVNTSDRNGRIVKAYLDHAADRKGIVFAADVQHSKDLTEAFLAAGVDARHVDGTTPDDERAAAFAWMREPGPRVFVNVGIATEGYDEPSVSAVILARPTKSRVLYTQMIGRGTRLFARKVDLLVIDLVDVSSKHTLANAAALFGLPTGLDLAGKSATKARARVKELVQEGLPFEELSKAKTLADLETIANEYRKISLFWQPKTAPEVAGLSALSWVSVGEGAICLRVGELRAWVTTDMLGHAHLVIRRRPAHVPGELVRPETLDVTSDFSTLAEAVRFVDLRLTSETPRAFTDPKARWRRDPASEKQVALLKKFRVPFREPLTKGEAGILLDKVFARRGAAGGAGR
jgi:superfamily II DNA or RNA helicase